MLPLLLWNEVSRRIPPARRPSSSTEASAPSRHVRRGLSGFGWLARRALGAPFSSGGRWHPRRDRSTCVLAHRAGTILLSGPLLAMASFGTPRGHSLRLG